MSDKAKMAQRVRAINPKFTEDQAIQIANFLMVLSEVFYEIETKSNFKNKAA